MINLNNLHGGIKLIKEIMDKNNNKRQPWSREKQKEKVSTLKNYKHKQK